jgi:hypothetical protein
MHGFGKPRQRGKKVFSLFRGSGPHSWRVKVFGMDIDVGQSFGGHEDRKAEGELGRWFVFRNESRRGIKKLSNAHARVWKPAPDRPVYHIIVERTEVLHPGEKNFLVGFCALRTHRGSKKSSVKDSDLGKALLATTRHPAGGN